MCARKSSRVSKKCGGYRKDWSRKYKPPNKWTMRTKKENVNDSSKKKSISLDEVIVPKNETLSYCILNFSSVFSEISQVVKCKTCNGDVKFQMENIRGLGFKVKIICASCRPTGIASCPRIGSAYEINRRFSFAMRCLGQGASSEKRFCGLMDLPPPVTQKVHDKIQSHIYSASKSTAELLMKDAVQEELLRVSVEEDIENATDMAVSIDGTWHKRGFSSLFGVCSLIGVLSTKIVDVNIKSSYCKACEVWERKKNTAEYQEWEVDHKTTCQTNHEGTAGKMEADSVKQMFRRSLDQYGVRYKYYIGDGDTKSYKGVVESKPYGDNFEVQKRECIGHVQKRMGTRLRKCKKDHKGIGGRNKLTAKMIDKLTVYYGLAIRRNFDSVERMRDAVWATFYHYSSTKDHPQHQLCPQGSTSWCEWQRANADASLGSYEQTYKPLSADVLNAIRPIYQDLSNDALLKRCLGGYTQNANESFNNVIWRMAPKSTNSSATIIQIATFLAVGLFNEGSQSLLRVMRNMGITVGRNAAQFAASTDSRRCDQADIRAQHATREARMNRRLSKNQKTTKMCPRKIPSTDQE